MGTKKLCIEALRHAEYYDMQSIFDDLYARSKNKEKFTNLMELIVSQDNTLLAYRNIKSNGGSMTPGTDGKTIADLESLTCEEFVAEIRTRLFDKKGYHPKAVRRKIIPKPNGGTRPLGIPCIWDRLIQQCILQVLEPICEAKFSKNSYGFRPNRSAENAIAATYQRLQLSHLNYVIEFDIKGFFDNVNHSKLIKQMWAMGIQDKHLIYVIKQLLKAPIKTTSGAIIIPDKGTPQGGIISPLLANIVLNELDHWVESQWENNPVIDKYQVQFKGHKRDKSHGYRAMRGTRLKEMYIVRYADDFRIFCRCRRDAEVAKIAITDWLLERLKLEVSSEKTRIVNVCNSYSEFLGFKIKLVKRKGKKGVVRSRMSDKAFSRELEKLCDQVKVIALQEDIPHVLTEVIRYNRMVEGIQNYYQIATHISKDANILGRRTMTIFTNRFGKSSGIHLTKKGRQLAAHEKARYAESKSVRFLAGCNEMIYPISYVKHRNPMGFKEAICNYTAEGRNLIHEDLGFHNKHIMNVLKNENLSHQNIKIHDNKISLFAAQQGRCFVTQIPFSSVEDIHCHHKTPLSLGGNDSYGNLVLVFDSVHKLIHASKPETIEHFLNIIKPRPKEMKKINSLRAMANLATIK